MVLTNMLPNQGNGTYVFYMYAEDREGRATLLGIADDDLHERAGDAAVRRDRYAGAGRRRVRRRAI